MQVVGSGGGIGSPDTGSEPPPPPPPLGTCLKALVSQSGSDLSLNAIRRAQSQPITVQPVKRTIRKSPHTGQLARRFFQRRTAPIRTGAK